MWSNFKAMPLLLKLLTVHALLWGGVVPVALNPDNTFVILGTELSFSEFWRFGWGPQLLFSGLLLPVCAVLFLKRRPWGRAIYVGGVLIMLAGQLVVALFVMQPVLSTEVLAVLAFYFGQMLVALLLLTLYLYKRGTVRDYFGDS